MKINTDVVYNKRILFLYNTEETIEHNYFFVGYKTELSIII